MTVINTNNAALKSQLASKIADTKLTKSAQRLSSGRRINSSADDAAGTAALADGLLRLLSQTVAPTALSRPPDLSRNA